MDAMECYIFRSDPADMGGELPPAPNARRETPAPSTRREPLLPLPTAPGL